MIMYIYIYMYHCVSIMYAACAVDVLKNYCELNRPKRRFTPSAFDLLIIPP